jgi:hypothetical protein
VSPGKGRSEMEEELLDRVKRIQEEVRFLYEKGFIGINDSWVQMRPDEFKECFGGMEYKLGRNGKNVEASVVVNEVKYLSLL